MKLFTVTEKLYRNQLTFLASQVLGPPSLIDGTFVQTNLTTAKVRICMYAYPGHYMYSAYCVPMDEYAYQLLNYSTVIHNQYMLTFAPYL